jgi:hypothetical protein
VVLANLAPSAAAAFEIDASPLLLRAPDAVLLQGGGGVDAAREWGGSPGDLSRVVVPTFFIHGRSIDAYFFYFRGTDVCDDLRARY